MASDPPTLSLLRNPLIQSPSGLRASADPSARTAAPPKVTTPPNVRIVRCEKHHLPSFRRINSLLLPIRYPDSFYNAILSDTVVNDLTRVAVWHEADPSDPNLRKTPAVEKSLESPVKDPGEEANDQKQHPSGSEKDLSQPSPGKVIGGIRCRLEPAHLPIGSPLYRQPGASSSSGAVTQTLYVQTITLLSPYRGLGLATALLDAIVAAARDHGVTEIYAHVWEANDEALQWYARRGFEIGEEIQTGYYTKLKPNGARVARKVIGPQATAR
ncbi:MAG: hypothetical protein M4579_006590 [Chaenotheca gracillima]|nr:MAG: hypothetical protein M4579_006590 [Chaenotheca gracillima]